jgi:hypothetical protein
MNETSKLICQCQDCFLGCDDWIMVGIGFLTTVFWALILYSLKPKLKIHQPLLEKAGERQVIKIPIENLSPRFRATRIHMEVAILEGGKTYHLETDLNDFAFIPTKKDKDAERKFTAYKLNDFLTECHPNIRFEDLINSNQQIRVRLHATHPFTGLGKTFEKTFTINKK